MFGEGTAARGAAASIAGRFLAGFAKFVTAPRIEWRGVAPTARQRIYFANHSSNGDAVLIWAALPGAARRRARPVAAGDYWLTSKLRTFIGRDVFRAILIERRPDERTDDPLELIGEALTNGDSLILFPEGRRNDTEARLLPFKSGIYHLGQAHPGVELVPVWVANLNHVMPRGEVVPIPLICTVVFGAPIEAREGEEKDAFLERAREALLALAPEREGS